MKKWLKKYRVRIRNTILGLVIIGLLIITFFVIYGYLNSSGESFFPSERDKLGQFGDYFGGTLNPIFGFASFIALLITIIYQAKELNASTKELKNSATALAAQNKAIELQSFEQTFFSWINSYQELLKSIESENITFDYKPIFGGNPQESLMGRSQKSPKSGRSQLYYWWIGLLDEQSIWHHISSTPNELIPKSSKDKATELKLINREAKGYLLSIASLHSGLIVENILARWNELYSEQEYQLDSLFRTLYRLIIWIDSQHESRLSSAQKWLYISIIRSQLSWIEMCYLYFNGLTNRGNKFKFLVEKYALFDNFTIESDASLEIIKKYYSPEENYASSAFSSEIAREKLGLPRSSEGTLALATTTQPIAALSA